MAVGRLRLPSGYIDLNRVRLMGILNTTPDSFSDKGLYADPLAAIERAHVMVDEGADIIDVGGQRAGPGDPVSIAEEIRRVVPIIHALKKSIPLPISIDTFKPEVASAAMAAGADIINSIGGFLDPRMRRVAVETEAAIVIMHIQGQPRVANPAPRYDNVVEEVHVFLQARVETCLEAGIEPDRILIDPGPGFGKTTQHDLILLRRLAEFTASPYPVLLAASRKNFIGETLGSDVMDRLEGSLAAVAWGVMQHVKIVRVHDVKASRRVVLMTEAVLNGPHAAAEIG